jgi:hypothetical protein
MSDAPAFGEIVIMLGLIFAGKMAAAASRYSRGQAIKILGCLGQMPDIPATSPRNAGVCELHAGRARPPATPNPVLREQVGTRGNTARRHSAQEHLPHPRDGLSDLRPSSGRAPFETMKMVCSTLPANRSWNHLIGALGHGVTRGWAAA